ncbi:MAG: RAMP superfamily CRISPR-associated protein [bacterium]
MLKLQLNQLDLTIEAAFGGPFLIKDGRYDKEVLKRRHNGATAVHKKWPNSIFISKSPLDCVERVAMNEGLALNPDALDYYVPGSSIRGLLRSHAEKIVRTMSVDGELCCDPFDIAENKTDALGCTKLLQKHRSFLYRHACVICKIFGAGGLSSRIRISEGVLASGFKVRIVDGIGIDRFSGSVQGANFKNQVLEDGSFAFSISIRNFEIWQLGLLAFVLRDLEDGVLKFGFGKTKGFGAIKGIIAKASVTYWRPRTDHRLEGFADVMSSLQEDYGAIPFIATESEEQAPDLGTPALDEFSLARTYPISVPNYQANEKITDLAMWQSCARQWLEALRAPNSFKTIQELHEEVTSENQVGTETGNVEV